jgi:hypothetical protein
VRPLCKLPTLAGAVLAAAVLCGASPAIALPSPSGVGEEPPAATPAPPSAGESGHDADSVAVPAPPPAAAVRKTPAVRARSPSPAPPPPLPPPTPIADPLGRNTIRFEMGAAARVFFLFPTGRIGPALEIDAGILQHVLRTALLFRAYIGDKASYLFGGRFDAGPRWGRARLSLGLDLGFLFTPDTTENLDMVILGVRLAGVVIQFSHVAITGDAFSLDFYVTPGTSKRDAKVEVGCSAGIGLAFFF